MRTLSRPSIKEKKEVLEAQKTKAQGKATEDFKVAHRQSETKLKQDQTKEEWHTPGQIRNADLWKLLDSLLQKPALPARLIVPEHWS